MVSKPPDPGPYPDPDLLAAARLLHRRWSVPVIAVVHRDGPAGFADLIRRTGASRETLAETVAELTKSGLMTRSDGARPVYDLSARGRALGTVALGAVAAVREHNLLEVALKKWPMVVLVAIGRGNRRFSQLQAAVGEITARALTDALKDLMIAGLAVRRVEHGFPPSTHYSLTSAGQAVQPVMDELARRCRT